MVQRDLTGTQRYHYYIPLDQSTRTVGNHMLLKLRGDPAVMGERVRVALQRVLPGGAYLTARPLRSLVSAEQRTWRMGAAMLLAFGLLALGVAAVGLHGVIGYNVSQRMHELGVRVALGAQRFHIGLLVVGQSVRYVVVGVLVGMVIAAWASRWVEPLLFRQHAIDPAVYAGVALLMLAVAFAASAVPALRATRVDPASALRAE
jgi:ABC-type lipoprotein release transport system permease subunit